MMETSLLARRNMVDSQIRTDGVNDPRIVSAFLSVPREAFVGANMKALAYSELEIETSPGRSLWTPRDFAKLIDALEPQAGELALVIGAGAGYECAVLNSLVETVIGIEEDEDLVMATTERLSGSGYDHVAVVQAPLADGLPDEGPFDVIIVNGMVETVPEAWLAQLSNGGRLGVVVDNGRIGKGRIYMRSGEAVSYRTEFDATPPKFTAFNRKASFSL